MRIIPIQQNQNFINHKGGISGQSIKVIDSYANKEFINYTKKLGGNSALKSEKLLEIKNTWQILLNKLIEKTRAMHKDNDLIITAIRPEETQFLDDPSAYFSFYNHKLGTNSERFYFDCGTIFDGDGTSKAFEEAVNCIDSKEIDKQILEKSIKNFNGKINGKLNNLVFPPKKALKDGEIEELKEKAIKISKYQEELSFLTDEERENNLQVINSGLNKVQDANTTLIASKRVKKRKENTI